MRPPVGKGAVSLAFVRLSVRFSFKVKRSRSPGPLMLTHIVSHIFRTARRTNFKLGTRIEDDDPHQLQAP